MEPFIEHQGIAAPLSDGAALRANVDTDAIIPSREMRHVSKTSLAGGLFANWRYLSPNSRRPNPDFILNQTPFRDASILLAGENFGCGSSREQAVWALSEFGVRAIIAPSFGTIFARNCVANGLLTVSLETDFVRQIARLVLQDPLRHQPRVRLSAQTIEIGELVYAFETPQAERERLLKGLDHIESTLAIRHLIDDFERRYHARFAWVAIGR